MEENNQLQVLTNDQEKLEMQKKGLNRRFGFLLALTILMAIILIIEIVLIIVG